METDILNIKDEFYKNLSNLASKYGFTKVDNIYKLKSQYQQSGARISINGKVMQQPPTIIDTIKQFEIIYEGQCSNIDDTDSRTFAETHLRITQNKDIVYDDWLCIYLDDIDELKMALNSFIHIK